MDSHTPFNSVSRLLDVATQMTKQPPRQPALNAWCAVFGVPKGERHEQVREVTALLGHLHGQVAQARSALKARGIPGKVYNEPLNALASSFYPSNLDIEWAQVVRHLVSDVMKVLGSMVYHLPPETELFADEELKKAREYVDELVGKVREADLPPVVSEFLLSQLALVSRAIREYRIRGEAAFHAATHEAAASWVANRETIEPYRKVPIVRKVAGVLGKLHKLAKGAHIWGGLAKLAFVDSPDIVGALTDWGSTVLIEAEALDDASRLLPGTVESPEVEVEAVVEVEPEVIEVPADAVHVAPPQAPEEESPATSAATVTPGHRTDAADGEPAEAEPEGSGISPV